jgi:hypothetical protein
MFFLFSIRFQLFQTPNRQFSMTINNPIREQVVLTICIMQCTSTYSSQEKLLHRQIAVVRKKLRSRTQWRELWLWSMLLYKLIVEKSIKCRWLSLRNYLLVLGQYFWTRWRLEPWVDGIWPTYFSNFFKRRRIFILKIYSKYQNQN